jgi:hypothetical protein
MPSSCVVGYKVGCVVGILFEIEMVDVECVGVDEVSILVPRIHLGCS